MGTEFFVKGCERMKSYVLALDQGTSSSRAVLFDRQGRKVFAAQYEFPQLYPQAGWVEHDPMAIWGSQLQAARDCLRFLSENGGNAAEIAAVGITDQRETTIVWNKTTGKPVYNAIVWQCRRTAEFCRELETQGLNDFFRRKTGLLIDPYFSGTKLRWILENVPDARQQAEQGELLFGTVDTWLLWKLTGGKVHATDYTNASRTQMFNIHTLEWDAEILERFGIPAGMLPEVRDSSGDLGVTDAAVLGAALPVGSCIGDQQAALFGQRCFTTGDIKNTYGTGGFLLMNTGGVCAESRHGLLSTIAWGLDGRVTYALEGSVFVSGAVIKWLRDELGIIQDAAETAALAASVPDNGGVYFVPAFTGLGTPYWDSRVRGAVMGLTRGAGRAHIVRAALEAIAYQTADVIHAMEQDASQSGEIRTDGGASQNDFLMQFQANILNRTLVRSADAEATALGTAFLAGLHAGVWKDLAELNTLPQTSEAFHPDMPDERRIELLKGWKQAVDMLLYGQHR